MVLPFPFIGGGGGGKPVWTHTQEESQRGALSVDQRGMIYIPGPLHTLCSSRTLPPLQGVTTGPGRPQQARSISSRAPSWVLRVAAWRSIRPHAASMELHWLLPARWVLWGFAMAQMQIYNITGAGGMGGWIGGEGAQIRCQNRAHGILPNQNFI